MTRKLRLFLCHATEDKPAVRTLYASLKSVPWIDPWLDEENLLPGQDWDLEIYKATRDADAIIICLSTVSVKKEGYVNKEIRHALDISQEKPEGAIYVIPLRLDDCSPSFEQLKKLQWADYFTPNAHERLIKSLRLRADALKLGVAEITAEVRETPPVDDGLDLYRFIKIEPQKDSKVTYPFWIGKYPVTNAQYERFLKSPDFKNPVYWLEFSKFDNNWNLIGNWGRAGLDWLQTKYKSNSKKRYLESRKYKEFAKLNPENPVVGITWYEANAYCEWLFQRWIFLEEGRANIEINTKVIRLPLESEWVMAAGGDQPDIRYPWDEPGKSTASLKEILQRANTSESQIGHTTPVNKYHHGQSPFGVMDMAGNVWEWQANCGDRRNSMIALRGGSWHTSLKSAYVSCHDQYLPDGELGIGIGFRVMCIPK